MEPKSKRVRLDTTHHNWNNDFVKLLAIIDVKDWQSAVDLKDSLMRDPVIATLVGNAKTHVLNMVPLIVNAGVHHTSSCRQGDVGTEPALTVPNVDHRARPMLLPHANHHPGFPSAPSTTPSNASTRAQSISNAVMSIHSMMIGLTDPTLRAAAEECAHDVRRLLMSHLSFEGPSPSIPGSGQV
jgi:hypothetical protein